MNILEFRPDAPAEQAAIEAISIGDMRDGSRGGRHGVFLNTQAKNASLAKFTMRDCLVGQGKGSAVFHLNASDLNENGGLYAAVFANNELKGGIRLEGSGDSISIRENLISGRGVGIYAALTRGASLLAIRDNNITSSDGGVVIEAGSRFQVTGNNIEQQGPGGSRGAMIDIGGGRDRMAGGYVAHNHLGAFTHSGITANLRVRNCEGLTVEHNTMLPAAATTCGIDIAESAGTIVGPNIYGSNLRTRVRDNGVSTVGVSRRMELESGWSHAPDASASVLREATGFASLWGAVTGQAGGGGAVVAILPFGFRPLENQSVVTAVPATGDTVVLRVGADGRIALVSPFAGTLSLAGVRFPSSVDVVSDL